jgi:hypothetical protein
MEIPVLAKIAAGLVLAVVVLVFMASKCFCLAPTRLGWFMMFSNIVY